MVEATGTTFLTTEGTAAECSELHTPKFKSSPIAIKSSSFVPSSPFYHQNWEAALNDVLGVLRIQYRNDSDVMSFLTDNEKIKQLQYSTAAKMEWNRRIIKDEMDSGVQSPTRSRRIAKEIAIDYVRRYLDGEEERTEMLKRIENMEREKDNNLTLIIDLERDLKRLKDEKAKQDDLNAKLAKEIEKMQKEIASLKSEKEKFLEQSELTIEVNKSYRDENLKLRDENNMVRIENQELRKENGALRMENHKVRLDNNRIRAEASEMRNENMRIREENQLLRDENYQVRNENLKLREDYTTLQEAKEQMRASNEDLWNENKRIIRDNLELRSREEELKILAHAQLGLLDRKNISSECETRELENFKAD